MATKRTKKTNKAAKPRRPRSPASAKAQAPERPQKSCAHPDVTICQGQRGDLVNIISILDQSGPLSDRMHHFLLDHSEEWYGPGPMDGRRVEAALLIAAAVCHGAVTDPAVGREQSWRFFNRLASAVYAKYALGAELVLAEMARPTAPSPLPVPPINSRGGGSA